MRCATPTPPTKFACRSSSPRAATRTAWRRGWTGSRSPRRTEGDAGPGFRRYAPASGLRGGGLRGEFLEAQHVEPLLEADVDRNAGVREPRQVAREFRFDDAQFVGDPLGIGVVAVAL